MRLPFDTILQVIVKPLHFRALISFFLVGGLVYYSYNRKLANNFYNKQTRQFSKITKDPLLTEKKLFFKNELINLGRLTTNYDYQNEKTIEDYYTHLADNQLNPDPSGCSLIVQFLYHANMTEQVYNSYQTVPVKTDQTNESSNQALNNQVELKSKRIKILRVLAIKTAAILDWNLIKFEKELVLNI